MKIPNLEWLLRKLAMDKADEELEEALAELDESKDVINRLAEKMFRMLKGAREYDVKNTGIFDLPELLMHSGKINLN